MATRTRNLGDAAQIRDNRNDYQDVTPEVLMEMYPTSQWQGRFQQAVYSWR